MNKDYIKSLIDKLLIEELTSDEHLYLMKQIESDDALNIYYQNTLKLKNELATIAESQPFENKDLLDAREALFDAIEHESKTSNYWKWIASACVGFILATAAFNFDASETFEPIESSYITSIDIQELPSNKIKLTGQRLTDFELQGSAEESKIQQVLRNLLESKENVGHRYTALNYLSESSEQKPGLIAIYLKLARTEPNLGLRLKAIQTLKHYIQIPEVQKELIYILLHEKNEVVRIATFDVLSELESSEDVIKNLPPSVDRQLLKHTSFYHEKNKTKDK